ncbi:AtpZ/AtpI family protein [Acetobacteraceae bacterium]|nr:AtpZ/AtpI family protein [Acetobacteraceae bacterium]
MESGGEKYSFSERIQRLEQRRYGKASPSELDSKEFLENIEEDAKLSLSSGLNLALHLVSDLIAGLIVGGVIGYTIDYCLSYRIVFFIIFVFLGFFAGLVNMWRSLCRAGFSPIESFRS